jgi:hypothetical protein
VLLVTAQYSKLQEGRNDAFMKPLWTDSTKPQILGPLTRYVVSVTTFSILSTEQHGAAFANNIAFGDLSVRF